MNSLPSVHSFSSNSNDGASSKTVNSALLALVAAVVLAASPAQAANLLVNPSFENNSGHVIPVNWTRFAPPTAQGASQSTGNYWIEGNVPRQSGSLYFIEWGACYNGTNNAAGIYQDFSSAPGSTYQASGWL